jgi:CheY-like chemotaxis protein
METLLRSLVPKRIRLLVSSDGMDQHVVADAAQVQQLIMNLVSNAAEAIGDAAGEIAIRSAGVCLRGVEVEGALPGQYVCVEVRDSGCGMDAETRARIFDPFFTTKFTGRGLGLSAVHGIVRGHQGALEVISEPGSGSTFRVFLPAAEPPKTEVAGGQRRPRASISDTILVVDDEAAVRAVAGAALGSRGFSVVQASNGLEAIQALERNPGAVALVLLDLTMPVMGGEEALDQLLRIRPDLKVIVSTGYGDREAMTRFADRSLAGILEKPYTAQSLVAAVADALSVHGGGSTGALQA